MGKSSSESSFCTSIVVSIGARLECIVIALKLLSDWNSGIASDDTSFTATENTTRMNGSRLIYFFDYFFGGGPRE